jgi:hypothetical protein
LTVYSLKVCSSASPREDVGEGKTEQEYFERGPRVLRMKSVETSLERGGKGKEEGRKREGRGKEEGREREGRGKEREGEEEGGSEKGERVREGKG